MGFAGINLLVQAAFIYILNHLNSVYYLYMNSSVHLNDYREFPLILMSLVLRTYNNKKLVASHQKTKIPFVINIFQYIGQYIQCINV